MIHLLYCKYSIVDFAKMICCRRNNVYNTFKRNKIDIL